MYKRQVYSPRWVAFATASESHSLHEGRGEIEMEDTLALNTLRASVTEKKSWPRETKQERLKKGISCKVS